MYAKGRVMERRWFGECQRVPKGVDRRGGMVRLMTLRSVQSFMMGKLISSNGPGFFFAQV